MMCFAQNFQNSVTVTKTGRARSECFASVVVLWNYRMARTDLHIMSKLPGFQVTGFLYAEEAPYQRCTYGQQVQGSRGSVGAGISTCCKERAHLLKPQQIVQAAYGRFMCERPVVKAM